MEAVGDGGKGVEIGDEEEEARVWSWGASTDGQLATGSLEDQHLPQPLPTFPSSHSISHIACGGAHSIALTGDGRVLTWGRGTCGQLGHGELRNCLQPKLVKFLESFTISYVSAGWNHSGFVTDTGHLFMCGDGSFGQLGNGDLQSHSLPVEVLFFASKHVEQIACGMRHSLVLVRGSIGDSVYGFGSGRHRQVGFPVSGTGRLKSSCHPRVIPEIENRKTVQIYANGDQSAVLTADGQLYTWGKGLGGSPDDHFPQILPSPVRFSQVALGWNHALAISDGEVYMLGGNHHGMLSSSHERNKKEESSSSELHEASVMAALRRVTCPIDGERIACIAAGAEHSALVTEKGTIMTWGWGEHGQLGLGDTCDQTRPQIVDIGFRGRIAGAQLGVYCGSGFTFVVKSV